MSATEPILLPKIDPIAVDRLTSYLRGRSWSQRPAHATARVLALMVRLWEEQLPFPTRARAAEHVGVSVPTVDLVLARHRTGELKIVYEAAGAPLRGRRWVVPSEAIRAIGRAPQGTYGAFAPAPYRRRGGNGVGGNGVGGNGGDSRRRLPAGSSSRAEDVASYGG
jgi:hypothetical protein